MVGHGHRLGEALGLVVDPPRSDGIHTSPVRLGLWMDLRIAVHLRGAGEHERGALGLCQPQGVVRTQGSHLQGLNRQLQVIHRARGRGEVEHRFHRTFQIDISAHVVLHDRKARIIGERRQIGLVSRDVVVHSDHFVAVAEEPLGQVGAQKPGRARHQRPHQTASRPKLR